MLLLRLPLGLALTALPERPLLTPWYRLVGHGDQLTFEYGQSVVVLEGAAVRTLLPKLLPLLDGTRTLDELTMGLGAAVRPAIVGALETLAGHRLLSEGPGAPSDVRECAEAAAAEFDLPPDVAAARLARATVRVVGNGRVGAEAARLLRLGGIPGVRRGSWRGSGCDLAIVAPAPDELDRLPAFNRRALEQSSRWLLLRPYDGRFASVGPLVIPGQTCCYECLLLRRAMNCGYAELLQDVEATPLAVRADAARESMHAAAASHVALRWLIGRDLTLPGVLFTIETNPALRIDEHAVLRVPRCPACSSVEVAAPPLPWHAAAAAA